MSQMRLQRFLSAAGVASRRKAEIWIVEGRVTINGQTITELGTKVDSEKDRVEVNRLADERVAGEAGFQRLTSCKG